MCESLLGKSITFNKKQKDDLQDNETYCTTCDGIGWVLDNVTYLKVCNNCYGGVNFKCKVCGEAIIRPNSQCQNNKCKWILEQQRINGLFEKATILKNDSLQAKEFKMYYSDYYGQNEGYFSEWEDFFEYWDENCKDIYPVDERPKYVFGTKEASISLEADNILQQATEDLHEDAYDNLVDIDELQEFLDKWCEKQTGTETYYEDNGYVIEIPWELY